jgi:hypothetical protein
VKKPAENRQERLPRNFPRIPGDLLKQNKTSKLGING